MAELVPGPGGVLTRKSALVDVRLVPPLQLGGGPLVFGRIKQGQSGKATLDLSASQIGEAIEADIALLGRTDLRFSPASVALEPKGRARSRWAWRWTGTRAGGRWR